MSDERFDLADFHFTGRSVSFLPGMAWALYSDDGPSGPCGQSMSITCPWSILYVFKDEDELREAIKNESIGRKGRAWKVKQGVIGDWSSPGRLFISPANPPVPRKAVK